MRIVRTTPDAKDLLLIPEDLEKIDPADYVGAKCKKGSKVVQVEDNLINRIILNFEVPEYPILPVATKDQEKLLDYQLSDVMRLVGLPNGLNLNPMGLGKTVETIISFKQMEVANGVIVVPKTTIPQWLVQLKTWWPEFPGEFIEYIPGKTPVTPNNIYILNYAKFLRIDCQRLFKSFIWDVLSVDEVHNLKKGSNKTTIAINDIPRKRFYGQTGTPVLNKPDDLWSLLNLCDPFFSGKSYWSFTDYFCEVDETFGKKPTGLTKNPKRVEVLNKLLSIVSVRNNVKVAPPKVVVPIVLEMEPRQKTLYNSAKKLLLDELPENMSITNALSLSMRLQQVTSWPGLFDGFEKVAGIKFMWIEEFLENNPDKKIVVYTRFSKTANALRNYLEKKHFSCSTYHGGLTSDERSLSLLNFYNKNRVLIGTIGSLGVGVDGLQKVSHVAIFIDREWSPEINKQCEDRLCRMGQKENVVCYYLECEKSWDQHVGRINLRKKEDIRRVLNE